MRGRFIPTNYIITFMIIPPFYPIRLSTKKRHDIKRVAGNCLEFILVILVGFGLFIYSSLHQTFNSVSTAVHDNDRGFNLIWIYELIALFLIGIFLYKRNWSLKGLDLSFKSGMLLIAILLVLARIVTGFLISGIVQLSGIYNPEKTEVFFSSGIISVSLVIVINSVYEEVLLLGYIFKRFDTVHPLIPFFMSTMIRLSYHTYQGWGNLPMIFAMALIYGLYYSRYRKLWPPVLAHALGNTFSFLNLHYQWFNV